MSDSSNLTATESPDAERGVGSAPNANVASEPRDHSELSAIRHGSSHARLWVVAVLGLVLDLWSKHWAMTQLDPDPNEGMVIIPHLMSFQRSLNTGALFGLGKGWTPLFVVASVLALAFVLYLFAHSTPRRRSLHIALGLILAGALGNLYDRTFMIADVFTYEVGDQQRTVARKKIAGPERDGGYRVSFWPEGLPAHEHRIPGEWNPEHRQQGVVRDFIYMEPRLNIGGQEIHIWPWVFNLADAWLVFGVGLLMLNFWRDRKEELAAERAKLQEE